jgi:ribose transport system substrate-binding protein
VRSGGAVGASPAARAGDGIAREDLKMFVFGNTDSPTDPTRRRWLAALASAPALGMVGATGLLTRPAAASDAPPRPGYYGAPRTWLWNPGFNTMVETAKWKKAGPYVIGFSNASISNAWRVAFQHGVLWAAGQHSDQIKHFLITDANDDPTKQIADIEDLASRGVDLLLIAPATEEALNPAVGRAMKQGIPIVMVDRKVTSRENYITFVTASDTAVGRIEAQWLCEHLKGKGNIVMLPGIAGASPAEIRIRANKGCSPSSRTSRSWRCNTPTGIRPPEKP